VGAAIEEEQGLVGLPPQVTPVGRSGALPGDPGPTRADDHERRKRAPDVFGVEPDFAKEREVFAGLKRADEKEELGGKRGRGCALGERQGVGMPVDAERDDVDRRGGELEELDRFVRGEPADADDSIRGTEDILPAAPAMRLPATEAFGVSRDAEIVKRNDVADTAWGADKKAAGGVKEVGVAAKKKGRGDEPSPEKLAVGGFQHARGLRVGEVGAFPGEGKKVAGGRGERTQRREQASDIAGDAGGGDVERVGVEADAERCCHSEPFAEGEEAARPGRCDHT